MWLAYATHVFRQVAEILLGAPEPEGNRESDVQNRECP